MAMPFLLLFALWFFQGTEPNQLDHIWKGDFTRPRTLDTIKVFDWNIDRGSRFEEIEEALERDHPDLCLLQEVDLFDRRSGNRNVAEALARRLELNYAVAPSFQELSQSAPGKAAYQGQAILTRLPIVNVRVIRFKDQSTWWQPRPYLPNVSLMQRRTGGRTALVIELKGNRGNIVVYNVHFESRSGGAIQTAQLHEVFEDAKRYPQSTPIILAGDFNTKYNGKAFLATLGQAGYHNAFGDQTPRTHRIIGHLDWILVHGPVRIEDASVVTSAQGSDHFPVAATVILSPEKPNTKTVN
jgi:endonuclease/exonuclease/phosphatase family metal-dependent hydrolase